MKQLMKLTLDEACEILGKNQETIIHYIEEEWIIPMNPDNRILDDEDIHRIRLITDLIERMGVNEEAVPVILHLIDQIHFLTREEEQQ